MRQKLPAFTREDEKELFKEDVDPNFLNDFRNFYSNNTESYSVDVVINLTHVAVDAIESWEPNEIRTRVGASFDTDTVRLKLPDNIRNLALVCDVDESSARDSEKRLPFGSYH
jgi:hypothetical protein